MNKEDWKDFYKKNAFLLFIIFMSCIVLIGSSYAWYTVTFTSTKEQTLTAGELSLNLTEGDNTISLTNTVPQSDEDGMANNSYTFTVENTGTVSSKYYIYLNDINLTSGTVRISDAMIRYNLTKGSYSNGIAPLTNIINTSGSRTLATGTLDAGAKETFSLRLWIKEDATTEISGQEFIAKLSLKGEQLRNLPNEPELVGDMIPVTYNGTDWIKASYTDTDSWYNYDNQMWANAVTIKDQTKRDTYKNSATGTIILMSDINTMFVWIPRYSYTIGNAYGVKLTDSDLTPSLATPGAINIKFVSKNKLDTGKASYKGTQVEEYYTPSSFCWGDTCDTTRSDSSNKELSGIWVSKFETTGTIDSISSIPNVTSLRNQTVSSFFTSIQSQMNGTNGTTNYGFKGTYDAHMMKNTEWGAMAYLSQSKYGKYGNSNYIGIDKEIYQNKSAGYITGSSNGTPSTQTTNTQVAYNVEKTGTGASTTGNIYGIYDTSGGSWEYVMGNFNNSILNSGFSSMPSKKYYNLYTGQEGIKGDATRADGTAGLYGDYHDYPSTSYPWLYRGGSYTTDTIAGIFCFSSGYDGGAYDHFSVRTVITAE